MKLWKRNAVVAAIVGFVCVAVYLHWTYQEDATANVDVGKTLGQATLVGSSDDTLLVTASPSPTPAPSAASTGYFASARLNRQQARDSAVGILQQTMTSDAAAESAKIEAGSAIETLAAAEMSEAQIENLVIAKGYADCVTFISDGGVSVVVSATETGLQDADVARITEIVTGETGVPASQITIIEAQG